MKIKNVAIITDRELNNEIAIQYDLPDFDCYNAFDCMPDYYTPIFNIKSLIEDREDEFTSEQILVMQYLLDCGYNDVIIENTQRD